MNHFRHSEQPRFPSFPLSLKHTILLLLLALMSKSIFAETSLTLQLSWQHQFQFAGYYAALHNGYYKDVGLDVTLKEGSANTSVIDEVLQQRAQFGVSTSGLLNAYLNGKPVLMLAPIFQHSPLVLLSLGEKLKTPTDIAKAGSISLQSGDENPELKYMFVKWGVPLNTLQIATGGAGLEELLAGKIVAMNAYLSDEPFHLQQRGIPYNILKPEQFGLDFYGDLLFTSRSFEHEQPQVVAAFRKASIKGWEYAHDHQEEIIDLILARYNIRGKSREALVFEAKHLIELISPDLIQVGHSNPERWKHIAFAYAAMGIKSKDSSLKEFLYDPNPPPPDMTWLFISLVAALLVISVIGSIAAYIFRVNRKLQASEKHNLAIQDDLHKANEIAQKSLIEQGKFMAMLTHELKTPISVVRMALGAMKVQGTLKRHADHALEDMSDIVDLCRHVDSLEQKKLVPHPQRCDMNEILSEIQATSWSPDRLIITTGHLPELYTDQQLLRIVLSNLISNAIKYSLPGSQIDICAEMDQRNEKSGVRVAVLNHPGVAGLPDPELLFSKYYRSPGAHNKTGSGLGLYLVRSITELLGGQISYDVIQQKVRFTLWIPC
jgi:signal transduction histidine kinase